MIAGPRAPRRAATAVGRRAARGPAPGRQDQRCHHAGRDRGEYGHERPAWAWGERRQEHDADGDGGRGKGQQDAGPPAAAVPGQQHHPDELGDEQDGDGRPVARRLPSPRSPRPAGAAGRRRRRRDAAAARGRTHTTLPSPSVPSRCVTSSWPIGQSRTRRATPRSTPVPAPQYQEGAPVTLPPSPARPWSMRKVASQAAAHATRMPKARCSAASRRTCPSPDQNQRLSIWWPIGCWSIGS